MTKEVLRIEQRRDVPPQAIADIEQQRNQCARMLGAIVLDVDRRLETLHGGPRAGDHTVLHALDIDFEEPQAREAQAVDRHQLHLVAARSAKRNATKIVRAAVVERRDADRSDDASDRAAKRLHIG